MSAEEIVPMSAEGAAGSTIPNTAGPYRIPTARLPNNSGALPVIRLAAWNASTVPGSNAPAPTGPGPTVEARAEMSPIATGDNPEGVTAVEATAWVTAI